MNILVRIIAPFVLLAISIISFSGCEPNSDFADDVSRDADSAMTRRETTVTKDDAGNKDTVRPETVASSEHATRAVESPDLSPAFTPPATSRRTAAPYTRTSLSAGIARIHHGLSWNGRHHL